MKKRMCLSTLLLSALLCLTVLITPLISGGNLAHAASLQSASQFADLTNCPEPTMTVISHDANSVVTDNNVPPCRVAQIVHTLRDQKNEKVCIFLSGATAGTGLGLIFLTRSQWTVLLGFLLVGGGTYGALMCVLDKANALVIANELENLNKTCTQLNTPGVYYRLEVKRLPIIPIRLGLRITRKGCYDEDTGTTGSVNPGLSLAVGLPQGDNGSVCGSDNPTHYFHTDDRHYYREDFTGVAGDTYTYQRHLWDGNTGIYDIAAGGVSRSCAANIPRINNGQSYSLDWTYAEGGQVFLNRQGATSGQSGHIHLDDSMTITATHADGTTVSQTYNDVGDDILDPVDVTTLLQAGVNHVVIAVQDREDSDGFLSPTQMFIPV